MVLFYNSLTDNQRDIIKELDAKLKSGNTDPQDIALGVGEGEKLSSRTPTKSLWNNC